MTHDESQPYRVLARKYRPQVFEDLIGQGPMVQTLSNAFQTGRIAQAYMLTGVRGIGKTTTARILARALNYKRGDIHAPTIDLKEEGEHCKAIIEGRHMDIIEMDAASHTGIDDVRDLIEAAQYRPATARYKVYIIDEVHMLSTNAFNGLLKTLEEPPEHLKFIFATTEIRKVPVTVLSRCQRFDLRRIEAGTLTEHLENICAKENVTAANEALAMVARAADGSVRDALSMLDQAIAHGAGTEISADAMRSMLGLSDRARVVELFENVMKGEIAAALEALRFQYEAGAEPRVMLTDLGDFIHLVTRLKYVPDTANDRALSEVERTRGKEFAESLSVRALGRAWQILLKGLEEVTRAERPLPAAEMVLVRMTHASTLPTPDELVRDMEKGQGSIEPAAATAAPPATVAAQSGEGQVLVMKAPEPIAEAAVSEPPQNKSFKAIHTFEELIFLIEDKRDLSLKTAIKRHLRLVNFSDGRIEMNLVENPPRDFMARLNSKLEAWTGKRWMLAVSKDEGQPTLAEQERAESEAQMDDVKSDPAVEAILRQFPGSKIVDIRVRDEQSGQPVNAPEEDDPADGE